jgi:hypothetical protein
MRLDAHNLSNGEAHNHQDIDAYMTASPPMVHNFPLTDWLSNAVDPENCDFLLGQF